MSEKELVATTDEEAKPRDARFWLIFLSLFVCGFITMLEMASITTALPTIVDVLHGEQFIWAGSAYALGGAALIPLAGGMAQIFGRRPVLLSSLLLFAMGSAVCGAARNMNMLIAGRTVQGLGAGGIASLSQIIIADLVSLRERGTFNGLIAIAYTIGLGSGPAIGGALATSGNWRWLFYLNIPVCAVAALLVFLFLRLRTPGGSLRERFARIDYLGNLLVVGATTSTVIGLTWGGVQYSWGSARVLAPLIIGIIGLAVFFMYEGRYAKNPMVPFDVSNTITGFSGYVQAFLNFLIQIIIIYYIEVYFQSCFAVSPTAAGVDAMALAFVGAPGGLIAGLIIQKTNSYRIPIAAGWSFSVVGFALLSTLNENSSRSRAIGFSVIPGLGIGSLALSTYFPVLAPIPVSKNAQALALFIFTRNLALVLGVAIGGTILQNELHSHLPVAFAAQFPGGTEIAYSIIPMIRMLPEPLRSQVRAAFAKSLQKVWVAAAVIAGLGLLVSLFMKPYPLHTSVDRNWGMEDKDYPKDDEEDKSAQTIRM
ncbi:iron permease [Mycena galopus ATCC 62051]|nr:iron permease [Mycena galopus ATCC 62051]